MTEEQKELNENIVKLMNMYQPRETKPVVGCFLAVIGFFGLLYVLFSNFLVLYLIYAHLSV